MLCIRAVLKEIQNILPDAVLCIFPGIGCVVRQFPADLRRKIIFPAQISQFPLNDRIQLFNAENLV